MPELSHSTKTLYGVWETAEIERVRKYATDHVLTLEQLQQAINGEIPPVGDNPEHVCHWGDFRIVFSYEDQPVGRCAHISVSIQDDHRRLPLPADVSQILPLFGMGNDIHNCENVWIEDHFPAVNVIRRVDHDA